MTISERIQLIKAGYTLSEIAAFAEEEKAANEAFKQVVENPVESVENPAPAEDWKEAFNGLSNKLDELIKAQQLDNVNNSNQPEKNPVSDEELLSTFLVPKYE